MLFIDLNSDVGEGVGNESQLMPYLSSCNIACGGHAGDEKSMREVLAFAKANNVQIGAHPSYPDRTHFGREEMKISTAHLKQALIDQIKELQRLAIKNDQKLHHVKPHGALYNKAAVDEETAMIIINAIIEVDKNVKLYAPYNSVILALAKGKLTTLVEGFADRNYEDDYTLVSRKHPKALLQSAAEVCSHIIPMIKRQELHSVTGKRLPFKIDTLCIHGDTKNAPHLLKTVSTKLAEEGIHIS